MRRITAGAVVLLLATACSTGSDDSASSTTVTTTTLPPSSTTTTLPPRAVTEVDACALLREADLERVLDDAGVGEAPPVDGRDGDDGGVPALVTAQCSWPSIADERLSLHYLAPTTAPDGPTHLNDVIEAGTGYGEGGTVLTQDVEGETVGILVDAEQNIRELAVVKRSALLYLLVNEEVGARDEEAVTAYREILYNALVRAPR